MPDLTIKPNAGSGNKVIIQDQAGGAVMTTADSGITSIKSSDVSSSAETSSETTTPSPHMSASLTTKGVVFSVELNKIKLEYFVINLFNSSLGISPL